jgi:hypothetical protein
MKPSRRTPWTRILGIFGPLILLVAAACGQGQTKPAAVEAVASPRAVAAALSLHTFESRYIQIDACPNTDLPLEEKVGCDAAWSGDANLFTGDDNDLLLSLGKLSNFPPHPSQSAPYPLRHGSTAAYIDWDDLTGAEAFANHFRSDFDATVGVDASAFPGSNSCVGPANVLDKMNLTYVAVSNNTEYAFFGVQRRDNSGDAGYMWIFNKLPPPSFGVEQTLLGTNDGLGDNCQASQYPLTFRVTQGDVLFRGHFAPGSNEPLLSVYVVVSAIDASTSVKDGNAVFHAQCPASGPCYVEMPAKSAINWQVTLGNTTSTLWLEKGGVVAGAAVNTGIAGLGTTGDTANTTTKGIGKVGLKTPLASDATYTVKSTGASWQCKDPNGCMQENVFAEVAVAVETFLSGGNACGATFYGSVISRSSGTTPSPDMKDLAGPFEFNFGAAGVTAVVTPTCGEGTSAKFTYKVGSYTGIAGGTVDLSECATQGCKCDWYLDKDTTPFISSCNYEDASKVVSGSDPHTLKLVATDGSCPASATIKDIIVYPPPSVSPALSSGCVSPVAFGFAANAAGSNGKETYAWTFSGGYAGSSVDASGSVSSGVGAGKLITGSLTLTVDRGFTPACTASGSATTTPWAPISVSIAPSSLGSSCTSTPSPISTDAIAFLSSVSGGSGEYLYSWTDGTGVAGTLAGKCTEGTNTANCTFDPADSSFCVSQTFKLQVTDKSEAVTGCGAKVSNNNTYGKTTTVTATNN